MPIDPFYGSLAIAGSQLLGGALSNQKQIDPTTSAAYWQNRADQREAMRKQVRWRVADARAAGVHPLFALGGSMGSFSPSSQMAITEEDPMGESLSRAGQELGRAVAAQKTQGERNEEQARLALLAAGTEKDLAQAAYYRSLANKVSAPGSVAAPDVVTQAYSRPNVEAVPLSAHPLYKDAVKLEPDTMTSRDFEHDGQTAGRDHPGFRQFRFPGNFQMLLPATQGGGMPEEIDASMLPFVVGANIQRYGMWWLIDALNYVTGSSPEETRASGEKYKAMIRRGLESWRGSLWR